VSVKNVLDAAKTKRALLEVERAELQRYEMVGRSPVMKALFHTIEKVAPTRASVLITGESGTGKELISRCHSPPVVAHRRPFVKVNCAAIPRELIESELFGHERGAFTGAQQRKRGFFEQGHGGTLFLDEIGGHGPRGPGEVLRAVQSGKSRASAAST
jgi:DNA-binding NtrC family response regulator